MSRRILAVTGGSIERADLDTLLDVAGCDKWPAKAVERHKQEELNKAPRANFWWYLTRPITKGKTPHEANRALENAAVGTMGLGALITVGGEYAAALFYANGNMTGAAFAAIASGLGLLLAYACFRLANGYIMVDTIGPAQWKAFDHDAWHNPAPAQAHALVNKITALLPDAKFRVHALMQDWFVLDPILEVEATDPVTGTIMKRVILVWEKNGDIINPQMYASLSRS
ncbi:MAG: hypothetical protein AAB449_01890 [Patescibacteria group bacterium]